MASFTTAIKIILNNEGGYVNNPSDKGGETNFGISKRSYPNLDIKNLTRKEAKEIYRVDYWNKIHGERLNNQDIAYQIFDFTVNAGYTRATKTTQKLLNIKVDGIFGEQTISNLNSCFYELFISNYRIERIKYYTNLARKTSQRQFLYSWIRRVI